MTGLEPVYTVHVHLDGDDDSRQAADLVRLGLVAKLQELQDGGVVRRFTVEVEK